MVRVTDLENDIKRIEIIAGEYSVSVLTLGAIWQSFRLGEHDVLLGYDDPSAYDHCPTYMGEVIGPIANRIRNGHFEMDGKAYELEINNGPNDLHSGSKNFGDEVFTIAGRSENSVTLSLRSGEKAGFPGTHEVLVTYFLEPTGELTIDYAVASDRKCPINVTNHAYFNLDGEGDIRSQKVMIPAEEWIETDENLIPVAIRKSEGTEWDFRTPKAIGERRNGCYDNCFVLAPDSVVVAEGKDYRLSIRTTAPAVQLYTGEFISGVEKGKYGLPIKPFAGFALETEYFPDFMNHEGFSGAYTEPGKTWRSTSTYKLERK